MKGTVHSVNRCLNRLSRSCLALRSPFFGKRGEGVGEGEGWLFSFCFVCGMCTVCHDLFTFPLDVIGRLYSIITKTHLFKYIENFTSKT